jgi:hypothetical protein
MVDHDTFMDDEFFKTLVLNHMPAAIGELAGFGNKGVALKKPTAPKRQRRNVKHDQPTV